ncbi:hypothetical protein Agub_g10845 [Astrephomene gubernaculifera]|uniref:Uncharacterized protein n=1 Tax=Astrephomene gubernaculifera TaxID=47775 RepID=A0AAD3DW08_9CHLO|nr:hypothetical protein Agub_g10845 [Astrephomene gubernaculifera]
MHLGSAHPSAGLTAPGGRRRALQVQAAKKDSSPWSSGGPKRGKGGDNRSGNSSSASSSSSNNNNNNNNKSSSPGGSSKNPWKDPPTSTKPSKPSSAGGFGTSSSTSPGTSRAAPPKETTITEPIGVTLLDELGPTESAAPPKWGTFCSHLNGEWVGQYAAYTPWEGKPEPAWLDERGKYINVVYTRALEHRQLYPAASAPPSPTAPSPASQQQQQQQEEAEQSPGGGAEHGGDGHGGSGGEEAAATDVLLRKMGRCTKLSALADLRLPPERPMGHTDLPSNSSAPKDTSSTGGGSSSSSCTGHQGAQQQQQQDGSGGGKGEEGEQEGEVDEGEDLGGSGDVDVEALSYNSEGVVVFDGGSYSAGPEYIGQQPVKLINDEALQGTSGEAGTSTSSRSTSAFPSAAALEGGLDDEDEEDSEGYEDGEGYEDEDEGEDEEGYEEEDGSLVLPTSTTSVFESCLVDWGSRTRMRAKLTLRIGQLPAADVNNSSNNNNSGGGGGGGGGGGEVDVEVLRVLLFREQWLGPPSCERMSCAPGEVRVLERPCTELLRPTPEQLQGSWNVFTMSATGFDEVDPLTGEEGLSWAYTASEEQQLWDATRRAPAGDDGATFWLPGGVVLSLRMTDNYVPAGMDLDSESGSETEGGGPGPSSAGSNSRALKKGQQQQEQQRAFPRGLCIGMAWLLKEGNVAQLEREYDGYGYVREVRFSQAVKGGWSGGRM